MNNLSRFFRGVISYVDDAIGTTGRETFTVSVDPHGIRTLRAVCEMDNLELVRDVTYTVNERFEAIDAYVRVAAAGRQIGSGWFRFTDELAEGEIFTAAEGRLSQRIATPGRARLFGSHPICVDIWKCAHTPAERPGELQPLTNCFSSSLAPGGASGPIMVHKTYDMTYRGPQQVTVPAGTFDCEHYTWDTGTGRTLYMYTVPGDWLPIRTEVPEVGRRYELVDFEELAPAATALKR